MELLFYSQLNLENNVMGHIVVQIRFPALGLSLEA